MTEQYEVKPSNFVAIYIIIVHVFTVVCVLNFDISMIISAVAVLVTLASMVWSINKWSCQHHYFIKYEPTYQCWSVSNDGHRWQRYESIRVAYLNDALVWITLSLPGSATRAALIVVDSIPSERFLQLRRCILCPDMFER